MNTHDSTCQICQDPKAVLNCGLCEKPICKKCVESLPQDYFSFLHNVPSELSHRHYCGPCFDLHIANPKQNYDDLLAKAENVAIFYKKERHVPVVSQSKAQLKVKDCQDRNEALLRLAFFAAEKSFDAVVHVELTPEKIKISGYQSTLWHASGFPARRMTMP